MDKTINKAEAIELFEKEAVFLGNEDVLPFYKAVDIFGEMAAAFIDNNMGHEKYLKGGVDYNALGACSESRPIMYYFYKTGFLKLVIEYNYLLSIQDHKNSKGGGILDKYMKQRSKRLDK